MHSISEASLGLILTAPGATGLGKLRLLFGVG